MKAQIDFTFNGNFYEKGQELNPKIFGYEKIIELNEKGFVYPLTTKDLFKIKKELESSIKIKKEDNNGNIN